MRQGRASSSRTGSTKPATITHKVPPAYAGRIGLMQGNHADTGTVNVSKAPMYEGRGIEAPTKGTTSHKGGSQGRY